MNGSAKKLLILAALASSFLLFGAGGRTAFSRVRVELKLEKPPLPNVSKNLRNPERVTSESQWLVVYVYYTPQNPRSDGPVQDTYLDDVKMQLTVLFPLKNGSMERLGMFKGGQTLWTVWCNGKSRQAMMFVPPHLLQRYVFLYDGNAAQHTPAPRNELKAEVVFFDRFDRELGRGYYGVSGNAASQENGFARYMAQVQSSCVIEGAFFERSMTPWSCMAPDHFDLVKPAGLKLAETPTPPRGGATVHTPRHGETSTENVKGNTISVN